MKLTRSKTVPEAQRKELEREFAVSTWLQTTELLKRTFKQYWRDPSYLYGKLFVAVIVGIFNGQVSLVNIVRHELTYFSGAVSHFGNLATLFRTCKIACSRFS